MSQAPVPSRLNAAKVEFRLRERVGLRTLSARAGSSGGNGSGGGNCFGGVIADIIENRVRASRLTRLEKFCGELLRKVVNNVRCDAYMIERIDHELPAVVFHFDLLSAFDGDRIRD
jgi:hypothetical protein